MFFFWLQRIPAKVTWQVSIIPWTEKEALTGLRIPKWVFSGSTIAVGVHSSENVSPQSVAYKSPRKEHTAQQCFVKRQRYYLSRPWPSNPLGIASLCFLHPHPQHSLLVFPKTSSLTFPRGHEQRAFIHLQERPVWAGEKTHQEECHGVSPVPNLRGRWSKRYPLKSQHSPREKTAKGHRVYLIGTQNTLEKSI